MNKEKLAALKAKSVKYVPIVSTAIGLIATTYAIFVVNDVKKNHIKLTADDREALKSGNTDMTYVIDGCVYTLRHTGPDHES